MGGKGSGRPPKNREPVPEETVFAGEPASPEPKKQSAGKKIKFTVSEVKEKIFLVFAGACRITRRECEYTENDFDQEAAALIRLAEKFPVVATVLTFFDPVVLVMGIIEKFSRARVKPAPERQAEPQRGNVVNMNMNR